MTLPAATVGWDLVVQASVQTLQELLDQTEDGQRNPQIPTKWIGRINKRFEKSDWSVNSIYVAFVLYIYMWLCIYIHIVET